MFWLLLRFFVFSEAVFVLGVCKCKEREENDMTPEQEKGIMQAFDAYCKTVLRNKARNLHKESVRQSRFEVSLDGLPTEGEQSMKYWDKYDFAQVVPVGMTGQEMRITEPKLAAALFQFLPRFREVLYLAYFMEYSDKEIGDLLEIPVSTVRSRRNNTLRRIREILEESHAI